MTDEEIIPIVITLAHMPLDPQARARWLEEIMALAHSRGDVPIHLVGLEASQDETETLRDLLKREFDNIIKQRIDKFDGNDVILAESTRERPRRDWEQARMSKKSRRGGIKYRHVNRKFR
jgi:hypothetical protein